MPIIENNFNVNLGLFIVSHLFRFNLFVFCNYRDIVLDDQVIGLYLCMKKIRTITYLIPLKNYLDPPHPKPKMERVVPVRPASPLTSLILLREEPKKFYFGYSFRKFKFKDLLHDRTENSCAHMHVNRQRLVSTVQGVAALTIY